MQYQDSSIPAASERAPWNKAIGGEAAASEIRRVHIPWWNAENRQ
jgi:hypothetical protein